MREELDWQKQEPAIERAKREAAAAFKEKAQSLIPGCNGWTKGPDAQKFDCKPFLHIKPLVRLTDGRLFVVVECEDLFATSWSWTEGKIEIKNADLEILLERPTLHSYAYHGLFKPSVGEVYAQIPKGVYGFDGPKTVDVIEFFETVGPTSWEDFNKEKLAFDAGYHVANTIFYRRKR